MTSQPHELQKEYALRFSQIAAYRDKVWKVIVREYMQDKVGRDRVVLDLGSGWCEFINNIQASRKYAMDLNPDGALRVASDVTFLQQDCSKTWALPDASLDVVFTSNFFEHLPSKSCLLHTLRQAQRCLKPGGRLICLGPNMHHLSDKYWDFFDHYLPLSHVSLSEGMRMADLVPVEVISRFLPYTMAGKKEQPLFLVKWYMRLPFAWHFFGKQFLVTAVKPR